MKGYIVRHPNIRCDLCRCAFRDETSYEIRREEKKGIYCTTCAIKIHHDFDFPTIHGHCFLILKQIT